MLDERERAEHDGAFDRVLGYGTLTVRMEAL